MTVVKLPELQSACTSKENVLSGTTRHVTDKLGLICFLILLLAWLSLWGQALYAVQNSVSPYQHSDSYMTNGSCENSTQINSFANAMHNLSSSINATIHIMNNSELFSNSYLWHAVNFLKCLAACYIMAQFIWIFTHIIIKVIQLDSFADFVIISTGKVITTLILSIGFFSSYSYLLKNFYIELPVIYIPEIFTCSIILAAIMSITTFTSKNRFRSVLRYYMNYRYLLLLRLLNLMMVLFLVVANIILSKNLYVQKPEWILLIGIGSIYLIPFLNNYNKMVTMTVSAFHYWSGDGKVICLKHVLSAIFIISKHHLGTVFLNTLFIRHMYTYPYDHIQSNPLENNIIIKKFGMDIDLASHTAKRSPVLTAVHGQNFQKATKNMISLELEKPEIFDLKSVSSVVWKDISNFSFLLALLFPLMPITNAEELWARTLTIATFFAIHGVYNYLITTMDIINFTLEYCKEEKEKNDISINEAKSAADITKLTEKELQLFEN